MDRALVNDLIVGPLIFKILHTAYSIKKEILSPSYKQICRKIHFINYYPKFYRNGK